MFIFSLIQPSQTLLLRTSPFRGFYIFYEYLPVELKNYTYKISGNYRVRFACRADLLFQKQLCRIVALVDVALIIPVSIFSGSAICAELAATAHLSRSITTEALTGFPDDRVTPAVFRSGMLTDVATSMKSQAEAGGYSKLPKASILLPIVPLTLADGKVRGAIAPASTTLAYNGVGQRVNLNFSLGYYNPERGNGGIIGKGGIATVLCSNLAAGVSAVVYDIKKDLVFNTVWQVPNSGFRVKATSGYLWGNQLFPFTSGDATIAVEQYSWALSTSWIMPDCPRDSHDGNLLHALGITLWGAQAKQSTHPDPLYFMRETGTDYLIYKDPLALSEGQLFGAAGDAQLALRSNLVAKGSLGYEQLTFPFSDGTRERNRSLYSNLALNWEPVSTVMLDGEVKKGAGETRYTLSAESCHWKLGTWYSNGSIGIADDKGVMLGYSLVLSSGRNSTALARRMQPSRRLDSALLLSEALARPAQLPQSFLAKVDPTAVTLASTVSKASLPQNDPDGAATIGVDGDIFITVGAGGVPVIQDVRLNGASFAYTGIIVTTATQVVVHTKKLAGPGSYVISVTDGNLGHYGIELNAQ
jgi:hypothetical protein